jgi:hypothetical protein
VRALRTELRRFSSRRAMRWMTLGALAIIALAMTIVAVNSKEETERVFIESCTQVTDERGGVSEFCDETTQEGGVVDNRVNAENDLGDVIGGTGVALLLLAVLLGTTFIGAEYVGGSLAGQLTFEPRRWFLYTMKAVAVAIGAALVTVFLLLVIGAAFVGVAQWRGVVGDPDGEWFVRRLADIGRVGLVAGAAAVTGFAITTVTRRSVAAVVGFLAFAFIAEPALTNALDLFDGKTPVFALIATAVNDFADAPEGVTSLGASTVTMAAWTIGLFLVAGVLFARREIR